MTPLTGQFRAGYARISTNAEIGYFRLASAVDI